PRRERAMRRHDHRSRRALDCEFLKHQRISNVIKSRAAILFRKENPEHPKLSKLVNRLSGITMRPISLDANRPKLLAREPPRNIARPALRFSKFKVHLMLLLIHRRRLHM